MILEHDVMVAAPVEWVWHALTDPAVVGACLPGVTLTGAENAFTGTMKVKLGPISLTYKGNGAYSAISHGNRTFTVRADGRDLRGNGIVTVTGDVALRPVPEDDNLTRVVMRTDVLVTGRPAQFGRGVLSDVGDKIVRDCAVALAERWASERDSGAATGSTDTTADPGEFAARSQLMVAAAEEEATRIVTAARAEADLILAEAEELRTAEQRRVHGDPPDRGWFATSSDPRLHHFWDGDLWPGTTWRAPESVFVSYAREDESAVGALVADLRAARLPVWLDEELQTGEAWWEEILRRIRDAAVFLHALSDASLRSTPCRAERGYAEALGLPIVAVQVGPANLRTTRYGQHQLLNHLDPTRPGTARLVAEVLRAGGRRVPLPDPLPEPPPVPFGYLLRLAERLDAAELSFTEQMQLLEELARYLEEVHDEPVRRQIRELLQRLLDRRDAANAVNRMARGLLVESELQLPR